jgi:hypothetical protein
MSPVDARAQFCYNIFNAQKMKFPFFHIQPQQVFPVEISNKIARYWPSEDIFSDIQSRQRVTPGAYAERRVMGVDDFEKSDRFDSDQKEFWSELLSWLGGDELLTDMALWLAPEIRSCRKLSGPVRLKSEILLVEDKDGYAIGPHTDAPSRLFTLLIYLPSSADIERAGTSIYVPVDKNFAPGVTATHYRREGFAMCHTAPFRANSGLGFVVSGQSFHGVERVRLGSDRRRSLMYFIKIEKDRH